MTYDLGDLETVVALNETNYDGAIASSDTFVGDGRGII